MLNVRMIKHNPMSSFHLYPIVLLNLLLIFIEQESTAQKWTNDIFCHLIQGNCRTSRLEVVLLSEMSQKLLDIIL